MNICQVHVIHNNLRAQICNKLLQQWDISSRESSESNGCIKTYGWKGDYMILMHHGLNERSITDFWKKVAERQCRLRSQPYARLSEL